MRPMFEDTQATRTEQRMATSETPDPGRVSPRPVNGDNNKLQPRDRSVHESYRFVLSYPPHLVREYLERFGADAKHCVLDPFCGAGTTLVECKKQSIPSIGIEANPMAHFAS